MPVSKTDSRTTWLDDKAAALRQPDSRGEELVQVAAKLFVDKGYDATSMQDVADAMGMLKGSLYHYIDSKEDLLWELARRLIDAVAAYPSARLDPLSRLRLYCHDALLLHLSDPVGLLAVVRNHRSLPHDRLQQLYKAGQKAFRWIKKAIVDGKRDGTVCADVDAKMWAHGILGAIHAWFDWFAPTTSKRLAYADMFADLVVAAIACDQTTHEPGHRDKLGALSESDDERAYLPATMVTGQLTSPDSPDRGEQILWAAACSFVEKGYDATSMQDIADAVGMLKGSLYHHVSSKEDLLWELARRQIDTYREYPNLTLDPLAKVRLATRAMMRAQMRDEIGMLALRRNQRCLGEARLDAYLKMTAGAVRRMKKVVVDGQRAGVICADLDPAFAARAIFVVCVGWFEWSGNQRLKSEKLIDGYADLMVAAVACDRKQHEPGHRRMLGASPDGSANGARGGSSKRAMTRS